MTEIIKETIIDPNNQDKEIKRLKKIAELIGRIFCYGNFKAETTNEKELEKLLKENNTFWKTEDEYLNQDKEIKIELETSVYLNEIEDGYDEAKQIVKKFQTIKYNLSCQSLDDDFLYEQEYNYLIEKHKNTAKESLSIIFEKDALKCIAWIERLEM